MATPSRILPLTPQHFTAIGRVAAEWSALEHLISYAVVMLLGSGWQPGKAATASIAPTAQVDLLIKLLHMRTTDKVAIDTVVKSLTSMEEPRKRRNEVVHASWVWPEGRDNPFAVQYRRGRQKTARATATEWSPSQIEAIADEISDLTTKLMSQLTPLLESVKLP